MIVILSACSVEKQSGENNEANSTIQTSETVTVTRGTLTPTVSAQTTIIQASDFVLSSTEMEFLKLVLQAEIKLLPAV